jgi:hypothetical protein
MPELTDKQKGEMLVDAAARLSEFFGSVQIHASALTIDGDTQSFHAGNGDWYARQGLAQEFIDTDQAETLAKEINREPPDKFDA